MGFGRSDADLPRGCCASGEMLALASKVGQLYQPSLCHIVTCSEFELSLKWGRHQLLLIWRYIHIWPALEATRWDPRVDAVKELKQDVGAQNSFSYEVVPAYGDLARMESFVGFQKITNTTSHRLVA